MGGRELPSPDAWLLLTNSASYKSLMLLKKRRRKMDKKTKKENLPMSIVIIKTGETQKVTKFMVLVLLIMFGIIT